MTDIFHANSIEHAKLRAGMVTGSVARTVAYGSPRAWQQLANRIFADDGNKFVKQIPGAPAYGHEHENEGAQKFWLRHSEYEMRDELWFDYKGDESIFRGRVGVSPDRMLYVNNKPVSGLEIKSPVNAENIVNHLSMPGEGAENGPHYPQCQHSMLVTGARTWWLVVHHGERYEEVAIPRSTRWLRMYTDRLKRFLDFMDHGASRPIRRMRMGDLK